MQYLYLDNFRGFRECTIPLHDANFLVGENSTGKTSVLTALQMLMSPSLLLGQQAFAASSLSMAVPELRHFREMVSVHSTDKSYFRIGLFTDRSGEKKSPNVAGVLITYREREGLPVMAQITSRRDDIEVSVEIQEDGFIFLKADQESSSNQADTRDMLSIWAKLHIGSKKGWTKANLKNVSLEQFPPFFMLSFAANANEKKDDKNAPSLFSFIPIAGREPVWIAPIRAKPSRTYDDPHMPFSPDGLHTPYLIKRMLESSAEAEKFRTFIEKIGKSSGLFENIQIKYFGSPNGPFEVDAQIDGEPLSLGWLGYGVSQSLPIIVELIFRPKGTLFAIQQPEVHLHPRAQAALGDTFFEMCHLDKKEFLIETHSDFAIDRFRMNYRKKRSLKAKKNLPQGQILFFERKDRQNVVCPILIDADGNLSEDQPESYREFFLREQISLLEA